MSADQVSVAVVPSLKVTVIDPSEAHESVSTSISSVSPGLASTSNVHEVPVE